ncbi:uncharacterized protein DAT39_022508, partial [Clarias magur]
LLGKSSKAQEHCMDIDGCTVNARKKDFMCARKTSALFCLLLTHWALKCEEKEDCTEELTFQKAPNFLWHVDSYDKLKPIGICINGAIDGVSRRILWMNAYYTSSDPKVIGGYFLETVRSLGGCPRILRADMGTENSTIRDMHRYLRRSDADPLAGEKSFIYGKSMANQRIKSWWGVQLTDEGNFDGSFLDKNLMLFCFLGLIQ